MKRISILAAAISMFMFSAMARTSYTISENWTFVKKNVDGAQNTQFDDSKWTRVNLPHCFNVEDTEDEAYGYYRGPVWYRKHLQLDTIVAESRIYLRFEAANLVTDVWVNGESAGAQHRGGYTPFTFDITELVHQGDNIIAVKVDNGGTTDVSPQWSDFTYLGGIYRDVDIIVTNKSHFDILGGSKGVLITTPEITKNSAAIVLKSNIAGASKGLKVRHIITDAADAVVATTTTTLGKKAEVTSKISLANPTLWDVDNPYLYQVRSQLLDSKGNVIDEVFNPLGVRTFRWDAQQGFFLNGRHLKLLGANKHQDMFRKGNALTDDVLRSDLKLMKESGMNCFRISHYPHDESELEMADRYGFICFEECPIINETYGHEAYVNSSREQIREMIMRDYNHPCIVAWNTSNEITVKYVTFKGDGKEEYGKELSKFLSDLNDYVHELDPTRPSMIVHCFDPVTNETKGFHQADILGYNKYFGWYEDDRNDFAPFADSVQVQNPKPFLFTEFGSGADVRIHSFEPSLFDHSEEFQVQWFKDVLKQIIEKPNIAGGTIWHFEDFLSEVRGDVIPHVNEKALVTRDRKRKAVFYYFKTLMSKTPFISIPSQCWTVRGGREDAAGAGVCTQAVEVFGNTNQVELIHNGRSLGIQAVKEHCATFNVPFVNGQNLLQLKAPGTTATDDFLKIDFTVQPYKLNTPAFDEIAINCGSHCYVNDDESANYLWYPDTAYTEGYCGHNGGYYFSRNNGTRIGTDQSIYGSTLDPVYQTRLMDMKDYHFDVSDGEYEVSFLFAESNKNDKNVFDVAINGKQILNKLNVNERYGTRQAVRMRYTVSVEGGKGITVGFTPIEGHAFINGLVVRRIR